jgi:hypothetical protein
MIQDPAKPSINVDGGAPGSARTSPGNRWGLVALRREQRERFESKPRENRAMEAKARPSTDVAITALGKKWWYICTLFGTNSLKEGAM